MLPSLSFQPQRWILCMPYKLLILFDSNAWNTSFFIQYFVLSLHFRQKKLPCCDTHRQHKPSISAFLLRKPFLLIHHFEDFFSQFLDSSRCALSMYFLYLTTYIINFTFCQTEIKKCGNEIAYYYHRNRTIYANLPAKVILKYPDQSTPCSNIKKKILMKLYFVAVFIDKWFLKWNPKSELSAHRGGEKFFLIFSSFFLTNGFHKYI